MTRNCSINGTPSDKLRRLSGVWGRSGAGLLITGNVMIDRDALTEPGNVILDDARDLDGVRAWAVAGQQGGAQIWMQINHPGKSAVAPFDKRPVAPSAVPARVLAGQVPSLPKTPPHLGYRPLDGYLELAWHNDQLHKIAAGRMPQRRPGTRTLARAAARITKAAIKQTTIPA